MIQKSRPRKSWQVFFVKCSRITWADVYEPEPANALYRFSLISQLQDIRTSFINNNYGRTGFAYQIIQGVNLVHQLLTVQIVRCFTGE